MSTNILDWRIDCFEALKFGQHGNFALLSCFVNGEPAAAIVVVNRDEEEGEYRVTPLFVSVTDAMALTDHDGAPTVSLDAPGGSGGGKFPTDGK